MYPNSVMRLLGHFLFAFACGCSSPGPGDTESSGTPTDEGADEGSAGGAGGADPTLDPNEIEIRKTTRSDIAIENLNAQISGMDDQLANAGTNRVATAARFFDLIALRTRFLGQFSDFATLDELSALPGDETPSDEALVLRARFHLLVHEFRTAENLLDRMQAESNTERDLRATIDLALHRSLTVRLNEAEKLAAAEPSFASHSAVASFQAALGSFEEADASYAAAEDLYRDVSPFTLAGLAFQRGVMWAESADRADLGEAYYRASLAYLPEYVVAGVHLSELLLDSKPQESHSLLLTAAEGEDPEPWGKLADFLNESSPDESEEWRERATSTYDSLLSDYPLAFADHGAEYFLGPGGEPGRGLELALENLGNRKNPRAYLVALGAAEENGDLEVLCELYVASADLSPAHPVLDGERSAIATRCPAQ